MTTQPATAAERAAAEAWFAHHGLPWFVDDVRADVVQRLTGVRIAVVGVVALAVGVGVGLAVHATPSPSFATVAGVSAALLAVAVYALVALHATPIARWALRRALRSLGLLLPW